jgi:REP element-mobilizing transposase RayT
MPTRYNPEKHHRRSIRLPEFDYKQAGAYFVTICTQNRESLFGEAVDGEIQLNDAGRLVEASWQDLTSRFADISLDVFVVMPNHIHGIILVGAQFIAPSAAPDKNQGAMNRAPTLGQIVRAYKASSTRLIRSRANANFAWQRNYYEHVIRNEESFNGIRQYILDNPFRWHLDRENPQATTLEPENAWNTSR